MQTPNNAIAIFKVSHRQNLFMHGTEKIDTIHWHIFLE